MLPPLTPRLVEQRVNTPSTVDPHFDAQLLEVSVEINDIN
jgi:hypothetical protein